MLGPQFPFKQHGESGAWVSDRLPHFSKVVDDVCFIKSMQTDQFNHGPAQLMVHTGQARMGHPSIGSWVTWGLGKENENLPGFIVLVSGERPAARRQGIVEFGVHSIGLPGSSMPITRRAGAQRFESFRC